MTPEFPMPRACPYHPPPGYDDLPGPVTRAELPSGEPVWVVTGYDEARALLTDPRISSDSTNPDHPEIALPRGAARPDRERKRLVQTFVEMDEPEHGDHRRAVIPEFTVRQARALRPAVQADADALLDRILAAGPPVELVSSYAVRLPAMTLARVFGVPEQDHAFFVEHAIPPVLNKDDAGPAFGALASYFGKRLEAAGDGVIGALGRRVTAGELSERQAVNTCLMLLVAGHETTANMIALGTLTLLAHPDQLAVVRREGAAGAVDELLRYLSIADTIPRVATADVAVGGTTIRAGDGVVLSLAASNRDDRAFTDAATLHVRRRARHHLAFGYGRHQCLGQNLARVELDVALTALFARVPDLRPAVGQDRLPVKPAVGLQGVTELPVVW
ncbi:MAG TPA: cytochrome P450 [Kribbellaceae bacterium]|jgi:pentalenic acid synthase